ncbi:MAG: tripartite tricarboxylate transporter TctB family protein [Deltaproteobacteria bacterium]|nr:tripartite tricarboxylate transporter TctB family protein [Deltaproteobacteria bacterium]
MLKYGNVIASIFFIIFSSACIILSLKLPLGTPLEPMPGFVPLMVGIFLLFISLILLVHALRGKEQKMDKMGEMWKRPAWVVAGLLVYSFVLDFAGYIIATSLLSCLILRIFSPNSWWKPIAIAIAASIASYLLFYGLLDVNLPKGILQNII